MTTTCHDFTCGNHGAAHEAFDAARHCRKCYGAARHPELAASLKRSVLFAVSPARKAMANRPAPSAKVLAVLEPTCRYRGEATGETGICSTCGGGNAQVAYRHCSKFNDKCYTGARTPKEGGRACMKCPVPKTAAAADLADPRPRLLLCSHYLDRTGAPIIVVNLARHLREWAVEVHSPQDGPLRRELEAAGIPVHIGECSPALFRRFDLIVANTTVAWPAVQQAKQLRIPCVWLFHESNPRGFGGIWGHIQRLIDYPREVVFPCQSTADVYEPLRMDYRIVPSIIPPPPARTEHFVDGRFHIVTFGHDHPRKGQDDLRAAVEGDPSIQLSIVHDEANPHEWLQTADLYVCSSRIEAFPLSLQEAKAYGLPVITTPVFGCSDIIRDGIDGLHYRPGDVQDLRAKIERIRTDPELRGRLSKPLTHLPTFGESIRMYDDAFAAAIMPRVVYHVAGMGPWWKPIVAEQLGQLRDAGLTRIVCTHVGEGEDWLREKADAVGVDLRVAYHSDDVRQWECPAIRLIERMAAESDEPILYLHSKGVSHDPAAEPVYHAWRLMSMDQLVGKWRENIAKLRGMDAIGPNWWQKSEHFSGNFWMARPSWIRKLPRFDTYFRDRYSCERWIGAVPGCRAVSLFCTDKRLWDVHSRLLGMKA